MWEMMEKSIVKGVNMKLGRVTTSDYKYDEKNSVKAEPQTRDYPGNEGSIAIIIKSIFLEEKTSVLKKLNIGMSIEFDLHQDIEYTVPNYKNKEDDYISCHIEGMGSGEILEILNLDSSLPDDEYQEVEIKLTEGFADNL